MLGHIVVVTIRVSYRYFSARHAEATDSASQAFQRNRRELVAKLNLWVDSLKSIASAAPYLGLAGTCVGILDSFRGYVGTRQGFGIMVVSGVSAAFLSTAAGLLVAVPAVVSYNYLRTRIESLEREISGNAHERSVQSFQVAQKLPLTARFSKIPFAVIAAPFLAVSIMAFMTFSSFNTPRGLHVGLASANCEYEGDDRLIVLRLSDAGELSINQTQEDWNSLPEVLSKIYRTRVHRTLYLRADDGVPFQTVADTIQTVADTIDILGTDKLNITVRLVTPGAMTAHCPEPVLTDSNHRAPQ